MKHVTKLVSLDNFAKGIRPKKHSGSHPSSRLSMRAAGLTDQPEKILSGSFLVEPANRIISGIRGAKRLIINSWRRLTSTRCFTTAMIRNEEHLEL